MRNLKALVSEPTPEPVASAKPTSGGKRERTDRIGQRLVAAHVDGETFKTFKVLSAEEGATTQAMVSEAMELLFRKYHKPKLTAQAKHRD